MATYDEVSAWVNPRVWASEVAAERVIEEILASGTDDEAQWVQIAGGDPHDTLDAAVRDYARTAEAHDISAERLREAVRAAVAGGMSESEASRRTGVTRMTIRSWLGK